MRVGGTKWIRTNVRLVCASNKNLEIMIEKDQFREDLFYRLKGATINIPLLRSRQEDIPELVSLAADENYGAVLDITGDPTLSEDEQRSEERITMQPNSPRKKTRH